MAFSMSITPTVVTFVAGAFACLGLLNHYGGVPLSFSEYGMLIKVLNGASGEYKLVDALEGANHLESFDSAATPVVWMHGMGDAGHNEGMRELCEEVRDKYSTHVVCLDVADGMSSVTTRMAKQLEELTKVVQADPHLKNGFHAIGNSQGGLLMRAYIEKVNSPPVKKFISWTGVQGGIAKCPRSMSAACVVWGRIINPYTSWLVFSDYWKDPKNYDKYLSENVFLPDLNNEKPEKNATYKANMLKLEMYVLTEATEDTMIYPHQSESHGYYKIGGSSAEIEELEDSQGYKEDWLGLKTLKESGRLRVLKFPGEHMEVPDKMWRHELLPLLGTASLKVDHGSDQHKREMLI